MVTINGAVWRRDADYHIDYDSAASRSSASSGPTDQLNIDYSYAPLFAARPGAP